MPEKFMVYAKLPTSKRFSPVNASRGTLVNNLIHATVWEDQQRAERVLQGLRQQNADVLFEIRKKH